MDIIETITEQKSWDKQWETHDARVEKYRALGHPIVTASGVPNVPDGTEGIVPLRNGVPDYSGQITWMWAYPAETPEERYSFPVATDIPALPQDSEFQQTWVQKEMPLEYNQGYSGDDFGVDFDNQTFEV